MITCKVVSLCSLLTSRLLRGPSAVSAVSAVRSASPLTVASNATASGAGPATVPTNLLSITYVIDNRPAVFCRQGGRKRARSVTLGLSLSRHQITFPNAEVI